MHAGATLPRMTTGATPIWQEPVRGFYTDPGQFVTLSSGREEA